MNPALLVVLANIVDIAVVALTKDPSLEPHLAPMLLKVMPAMSHAAGETPEQTVARRAEAEAIFAKYDKPIETPTTPPAGGGS